ncbi:MAG: arsenate reductase ArsC [Phycisphaerae bacterium]|nr:arsenate reductase ArsC [Phycisphaerae bacterium]
MKIRVLFICTGNNCRSQMAEALLRNREPVRFEALSAGSHPAGFIHPLAIAAMEHLMVPVYDQYSKSWDEYAGAAIDVIITLCDDAARENCPIWPVSSLKAHWPLPDPAALPESEEICFQAALTAANNLQAKIERLIRMDFFQTDPAELQYQLHRIGQLT